MANAIIFTDRVPRTWSFGNVNYAGSYLTPGAGAYKIASVLRAMGLTAIVVPNCLNLTLQGVRQIIDQNSDGLLWVGISTTFLGTKINKTTLQRYREVWESSKENTLDVGILFEQVHSFVPSTEVVWGAKELKYISDYIKPMNANVLIGGPWANILVNHIDDNTFAVEGSGEEFAKKFTQEKLLDSSALVKPFANTTYDDVEFKSSIIQWEPTDLIDKDMWLPIEVARGCAFSCAYCSYTRRNHFDSFKDPKTLRQELIRNYEMFGVTKYIVLDDLYNDSKEKVRVLYDEVWSKLPFKPEWGSYMRLDMFWADKESADIILASGARIGSFGIETLNDTAGKKVGKGLGRQRTIETLQMLKEKWKDEILIHSFFISGLPNEPRESLEDTIEWLKTTDLINAYQWTPLWITPPSHKTFVKDMNMISIDNNKYGVEWLSDTNWVNNMGISFEEANDIAKRAMETQMDGASVSFGGYADLRLSGFSHQEIYQRKNDPLFNTKLIDRTQALTSRISKRMEHVLTLRDHI